MKLPHRRKLRWFIAGVSAAVIVLAIGVYIVWSLSRSSSPSAQQSPTPAVVQSPTPVSAKANTLFFGNMYWGRYINDWSMASPLKTAYPFSRLNEFHRDQYDAWITGLECPTVAGFTQTSAEEDETLSFNCSPSYLPEAAKWFTAVTLANNHTDNRGADGFTETKKHLEERGIQYFGHYDPYVIEDACEVVALPFTVTYSDKTTKQQPLPVAFCAFHGVFKIPPQEAIDQITKYAEYMPVIAMPHMGAEYKAAPDQLKTATYRAMIDAGADMVIGDHPHWIQTTEAYKGKLIVYSMGNFMFDQQTSVEVTRSAAINVVMNTTSSSQDNLADWLALGDTCNTFHDTCLQTATSKQLPKITMEYGFGVVGTNDQNKITKPATKEQQAAIEQRLQWSKTMSQLQPPQKSL